MNKYRSQAIATNAWRKREPRMSATRRASDATVRRDSKYLLTSFGRCAFCGGGLHVHTRSHGSRRASYYACTSHYKCGPEVRSHVDQRPMEEINREVIEMLVVDMLRPKLVDEVIAAGRAMFDAPAAEVDYEAEWRRELVELEREQRH